MKWQTLTVLIVLYATRAAFAQNTYTVLPSDWPVTKCPVKICYNLVGILNGNILGDNVSNVTLRLLPGVHMISSDTNTIFSISSATNLTIKGGESTQRATVKCNGSIGFEFNSCTNLIIKDISIEDCGALKILASRYLPKTMISVYISHSLGVYIQNTHILNGTGTGLLLENVQDRLQIFNSSVLHHECDLYIVSYDTSLVQSKPSMIQIFNSSFKYARARGRQHYSGVTIHMFQTKFYTKIKLKNVNVVNTKSNNLQIRLNMCTNSIETHDLHSICTNTEQNLYMSLTDSIKCIDEHQQVKVTMKNTNFNGGEMYIKGNENLANIILNNTNISQFTVLSISELKHAFLTNTSIQKSESQRWTNIKKCTLYIIGYFLYYQNQGSLLLVQSNIIIETHSSMLFRNNSNSHESPLLSDESNLIMMSATSLIFEHNSGHQSGGIIMEKSIITLENNTRLMFLNNSGKRGGAIAFYNQSKLIFAGLSNLTFISNHASIAGGAIYVHDHEYINKIAYSHLSFHKFIETTSSTCNPNITFINNTAVQAGFALYGGTGNKHTFSFDNSNKDNLSVGSTNPFKVCMCNDSIPNCTIPWLDYYMIPGQPFTIDLVAVGHWDGVVPANIQIDIRESLQARVKASEYIQSTGTHCTKLHYTFTYLKQHDSFNLKIVTINRDYVAQQAFLIRFILLNCSLGFSFTNEGRICVCSKVLTDQGIECDIETKTVQRPNSKWINATFDHLSLSDQSGIIVHNHCPYDYCMLPVNDMVQKFDLNYPDQQCAFHRSGILCGGCEANFSQVLGTSKCKLCTNSSIPLLFLIALAGVALVVCLMFLNAIVSVGAINGLIFYANILRVNSAFYFPQLASTTFLSIFIAWLNLDLGIEACLYNGLDAYFKTWLQFVFPIYIWLLVAIIIVTAHYSAKASKLVGRNPVQVLATLFLLSYAKMLRTIITIFSSTTLAYPDGYVRRVWLYDGNVDFMKGKHIALFIVALIFLAVVSIPFTATLLCIQWLQKISHYKLLFWVIKLQPLFDAYTGPYKLKHRYWTGLLLLVRVCLFLVFSFNTFGDPTINLLATVACTFSLLVYLSMIGGVYKLWWINLIETVFIMNLGLLSAAGLYKVAANIAILPITYTSTGIAFMLFVTVIPYPLVVKVVQTKCGQAAIGCVKKMYHSLQGRRLELHTVENCSTDSDGSDNIVTYSEIELTDSELLITNYTP